MKLAESYVLFLFIKFPKRINRLYNQIKLLAFYTAGSGIKEHFTFILALLIISAYLIFFGSIVFLHPENKFEGLQPLTATLGTIVAAVVGYYFGQRPGEQAIQSAKENKEKLIDKSYGEIADIEENLNSLKVEKEMLEGLLKEAKGE